MIVYANTYAKIYDLITAWNTPKIETNTKKKINARLKNKSK